ncbi:NAD(P)-dependent dehydrogenase, short-chain alcohol dehydrogenase family [Amycolatopsis marina]|uniref:NAD(P)-dependent dehydrogenase, short-chain alcohol dehydrogenase family n=1 Tax=Amycolatopsis marina TaxID=490629 RepID=A0A1I0ZMW6_9PSEU|nr:SDR family oxidoreductase [Amycolatopsis marina]SFB26841.1 NAD(P)-dependent dehydrogenase, short-chain alcohol dehydrogenase family [Amycolatopsis marina]
MTAEESDSRGVLVTGASKGIGRAVALAFAARGDRVAVHYGSDTDAARRTLSELPGGGHLLVPGDLSEPDGAQAVADRAEEGLGGVCVLVNNAAVGTTQDNAHPVPTTSYSDWQRAWETSFAVNVFGAANLTFCVTRKMIAAAVGGRVINVGSRGAFRGEPEHPAYGAGKAALQAFGQSLALSLAPHGIAVTSVAPGFTATERVADRLAGPAGDALRAQSPFGRVGSPGEIAEAVVYLASGPAEWASGAILDLNGASHLRM